MSLLARLAACAAVILSFVSCAPSAEEVPGGRALSDPCNFPHSAKVEVGSTDALRKALSRAKPGQMIRLRPGTYRGTFKITASGTSAKPIVVCGPEEAVLDGGSRSSGYVLHLNGAEHWVLSGFTVKRGKKGIVLDDSNFNLLTGLVIRDIGEEGVRIRKFSSDNVLSYSEVRKTGLLNPGYGEGVYIGTTLSQWKSMTGSSSSPDRSDRNRILNNDFQSTITAEHIDIKEGTSGGEISGNTFDGRGISGKNYADSWIDLKGNGYVIADNTGVNAPADGFQLHVKKSGWGNDNVFRNNEATINGPGYGFNIGSGSKGNRVFCDNTVKNAGSGLANVNCTQTTDETPGNDGVPPQQDDNVRDDDDDNDGDNDDGDNDDGDNDDGDNDGGSGGGGSGGGGGTDGGSGGGGSDSGSGGGSDGGSGGGSDGGSSGGSGGNNGGLNGNAPPSKNFDLARWYLTLPSGSTVQPKELNSGYQQDGVFFTDRQTGGMVFRCVNRGGTTRNSSYSRTELREMRSGGGSAKANENNWKMTEGGTLRATLRVDRVSTTGDDGKVGRVIVGQIHGDDSEPIRLYFHKKPGEARGRIYAGHDTASNRSSFSRDIIGNSGNTGIALGETFSYDITLKNTQLTVTITRAGYSPVVYKTNIDSNYSSDNMYFKAGVYNQNNTGDSSDYAQATFFALSQSHP